MVSESRVPRSVTQQFPKRISAEREDQLELARESPPISRAVYSSIATPSAAPRFSSLGD